MGTNMVMAMERRKANGTGGDGNGSYKYDAMYARYSSHAQDDGTSIAIQIESCEKAAGKSLKHFIDEAKTGRTTGGRTELLKLISEAEAGRIERLYVYKFDRLGRAAETHVLVEDLEQHGVEVISVTEGTNALARGVQLVVAADYSRVLAERTRDGLVQRHKQGCWTGGPPPYGYHYYSCGRRMAKREGECGNRTTVREDRLVARIQAAMAAVFDDMDDLMADCRQAFLEAKANFASLMTPSQMNRFVADVIGPMAVLPDGRIAQKEAVLTAEAMRTAGIAGAGLEPATSGL
jgi:DNA invertase Pin-like site-specific DNA recombinase